MRTGIWFLLVGGSAALTHMAVFAWVLPLMWPEVANGAGFLVAFLVSFIGHRHLSFQDTATPYLQSLLRFSATALAGFVTNEAVFVVLFRLGALPAWVALFAGMAFAALQTFVLSRFWAFRRDVYES
jgi:putative flippase GtrA